MKEKLFIAWLAGIVINKDTLSEDDVNAIRVSLDWVNTPESKLQSVEYHPTSTILEGAWPTNTTLTESNH